MNISSHVFESYTISTKLLILNLKNVNKKLLKFSSKRILYSAMMASALLAGSPGTAFADTDNILEVLQNSTVRGKVVDASGEPVIGASVVVKGTTTGVITDLDGNFILSNVSGQAVLVISYVGYKSQEIAVSGKSAINVTMQEDSEMLDEVVVVGYGAMKKSSLTGSVTVVDSKIFENKGSMSNPLQALQGQAPGVRITRSSSAPGEGEYPFVVQFPKTQQNRCLS